MSKKHRKKLQRAAPAYGPGGALTYVPAGAQQGVLGQTFYGSSMKNIPTGQSSLFSPGVPLPAQPNVDPQGKPVQFRYPISYNTFAVDRTLGLPDIPSFEQLRRLAKMYSGITLNERYWLDMVPRMMLDIRLKKVFADAGAEVKNYQKEIKFFKNFWEKPDGRQDIHTWLRKLLREQSQIDEVYLYKNRTRGRKLLGLWIVAGDQMKPLLDDWGMEPEAPAYAYQQYPWGIPGMQYSTDMMIHYQESPAADTPYGFSRVERVILIVNQALRKQRKDLANFTEGNIPQSFMEVPDSMNWTPDQIDAYEQSWNALLAGNAQQQIRMKFLQPGMKYIPAEQYQMMTDFDLFLFRVTCGCYGVPPTEFGFTDDANRATGESQEDLVYRRTIGPNAKTYARIMTQCMAEDFPSELHGEMFEAHFVGYEEIEDEQKKATAITTYTGAGVLGLTDAAKMANLPIDPDAPSIGRMIMTATGPIWLDDVAMPEMRKAQQQATLAGYQLAANPPEPAKPGEDGKESPTDKSAKPEDDKEKPAMSRVMEALAGVEEQLRLLRAVNVTRPSMVSQQGACTCATCRDNHGKEVEGTPPYHDGCDCKVVPMEKLHNVTRAPENTEIAPGISGDRRGGTGEDASRAAQSGIGQDGAAGDSSKEISAEYRRWRTRALEDIKAGRQQRGFTTTLIPEQIHAHITQELARCMTADEVRAVFERAKASQESDTGSWQASDREVQAALAEYARRGVVELEWLDHPGACEQCARNGGKRVKVGQPFPTGALVPTQHPHCICQIREIMADGASQIGNGIRKK